MARMNDNSCYVERWSNAKLMSEARRMANLEDFSGTLDRRQVKFISGNAESDEWNDGGDAIREATRLYRETWLAPVLNEIERRFVKVKA